MVKKNGRIFDLNNEKGPLKQDFLLLAVYKSNGPHLTFGKPSTEAQRTQDTGSTQHAWVRPRYF